MGGELFVTVELADVQFDRAGAVATVTLARPAKLNTVTAPMARELQRIGQVLNEDDSIRAVILKGAGERAFSAGSDVRLLDQYGSNWSLRNRVDYCRAIWEVRKPIVAAIHGYAIGGGLELALSCDIRLATPDARFGAGEIKLGWVGGAGNTQLLPRLVGYGKALEMLPTGDLIDAEEARACGLVQRVVPAEQLDARAEELAEKIAANAPIAVQLAKHLVRVSESSSLNLGLAYENDLFTYCFTTRDSNEGREAFLSKRKPVFKGE